ncbi:MAG: hypothetical protein NC313_12390 [Butyrivibrio sp.]|nr:hypothetical protein [Butyrivibrio sp.]
MNITKKIRLICIMFCAAGAIIFMYCIHNTGCVIHEGIERKIAVEKCSENENYHLVKLSGYNTGLRYIISEGEDEGIEVKLEGITPMTGLSDVFDCSDNEFLVYGLEKNIEKKTTNAGSMEYITEPYTIVVEGWEIVTPIYRDYTYSQHERIFYPKKYIDNYDLEHGDYKIIN